MILTNQYKYNVSLRDLTREMVSMLNEFNKAIGINNDLVLHYGVEGVHSAAGYHPHGKAVDLHIESVGEILSMHEQYEMAVVYWTGGIGVYPWWQHRGLHLDLGPANRRWFRDAGGNYKQIDELKWKEV